MKFTKMHGIGNDFVVVDCYGADKADIAQDAQRRASFLCDRKFGIGADGVILVLSGQKAKFRMRMFNPDGSEAEMCGNGIRCFAKYVYDNGLSRGETHLPVETGAGLLHVEAAVGPDGRVSTVRVDMGRPTLMPRDVPTELGEDDRPVIDTPLELSDRTLHITAVSMGNPHAVTFVDDVAGYPLPLVGPQVEAHPAFPKRTNAEFIQVVSSHEIKFRVWERGAAETLACGTGASAAVVAGALSGRTGRRVLVHLPGGDLDIEWSETDDHVYMTGAAAHVFEGII